LNYALNIPILDHEDQEIGRYRHLPRISPDRVGGDQQRRIRSPSPLDK
jgi:hypothetical protein